jgi:hypothetical protein
VLVAHETRGEGPQPAQILQGRLEAMERIGHRALGCRRRGTCLRFPRFFSAIPAEIRSKIFQPFFTTKPTGQGTGLGLSLSYDLVKAHGGMLTLKTELKEGSEFIITIPKDK